MIRITLFVTWTFASLGACSSVTAQAADTWTAPPAVVKAKSADQPQFNYEEDQVRDYKLPDPLIAADGSNVSNETWPQRRAEILEQFRKLVYGRNPVDRPKDEKFEVIETDPHDLDGRATRKLIEISFDTPHAGRKSFQTQLFLPNAVTKPAPVIVLLQFRGLTDRALPLLIERGYGLAVVGCPQVAADDSATYRDALINAFSGSGKLPPDAWATLAAWAWAASRVVDYLETDPKVDKNRIGIVGLSRMGKAALWAGATDERFAIVYSCESGCGGAALSKRNFGETLARINGKYGYWFCDNFHKFSDNEDSLPLDQHMLLALAAPRLLYVSSADEDLWSDPRGEFLACVAADPVYKLLGVEGLGTNRMPPLEKPIAAGQIGYHIRRGKHGITDYDWQHFLNFADRHLPSAK